MAVYQSLSVEQISQNSQENTSRVRVRWQTTQNGGSYNLVQRQAYWWVQWGNEPEMQHTVTYTLPGETTVTLVDTELTIPHNDKGEASVTVRTWMDTHLSAGEVTLRKTLTLDTLARVTTLVATDGMIGGYSRLALTRRNVNHSHSIAWEFGTQQGYITPSGGISTEEVRFTGELVDFLLPESFYDQIPNAKKAPCTLTVTTYQGLIPVGDSQKVVFQVSADPAVCSPAVDGSVIDIQERTVALTGDNRIFVRHSSTAQCIIAPMAQMGAEIVKNWIQGQEVEGYLEIPSIADDAVTFATQDSRGFTATCIKPLTVVPYVPLGCDAEVNRLEPVGKTAVLTVSGDYYDGSFGAQDNGLWISYSLNGVDFIPVTPELTENGYRLSVTLEDMDYTRVYYITLRVRDQLTSWEKVLILKKSIPVFDWGEKDFAFHVPVRMDSPLGVSSGGTGATQPEEIWKNLGMTLEMVPGMEYATWYRFRGKPVYTMLWDTIFMENNGCAQIFHYLPVAQVVGCTGCLSDGRSLPWGGAHNTRVELYCDREKIYVDTAGNFGDMTASVQIFYTKE